MNRKILALLLVLTIAVGFTMASVSSVSAAKKTVKFKEGKFVNNKLGKGDNLGVHWAGRSDSGQWPKNAIHISVWSGNYYPKYYKITKAKIQYVKKVNGKNKFQTKTYKPHNEWCNGEFYSAIDTYSPKGWKPYKTTVYYEHFKPISKSKDNVDISNSNSKVIPNLNVNLFKKEPSFTINNPIINVQDDPQYLTNAISDASDWWDSLPPIV